MLEFLSISGLINALTAISFGILVILKNWREKSNQLFFLMTFSLAIWAFSYWQWLGSTYFDEAVFWVRLLSVGSVFIPVTFFHWVIAVLNKQVRYHNVIIGAYSASIFISLFVLSSLFIDSLEQKLFFPFWPNPGILYSLYFFTIYSGLVLFSLFLLIRSFNSTADRAIRGQLFYIILGAVLGFGGGLTNFFLWYNIFIPPYGNFFVVAFPFLLGYSALKHHLFSLKTIATEILVFFIVVILIIQAVLSTTVLETVLRVVFLLVVSLFGYLLIRSVYREVEAREEIERLAKNLSAANERLKELDKLKSEFVSIASHQLRSPLAAIKGYASLIVEGSFGKAPKAISEAVDKIFQSAQSLVVVVEDFLNVSRIELGRMKYEFATVDIEKLVREVAETMTPSVTKAGLRISVSTDRKIPYGANIDAGKIRQVITNLIDNAIKYTPKGSITINLSKKIPEKKILIAVTDTGVGIDPITLPQLFEKFTRARDANKTNTVGTGLGLYVAKEMVKEHGGRIWAESAGKGKGSTFFFELNAIESKV